MGCRLIRPLLGGGGAPVPYKILKKSKTVARSATVFGIPFWISILHLRLKFNGDRKIVEQNLFYEVST